jgi:uncharacterized RDD family membrane protein YckC
VSSPASYGPTSFDGAPYEGALVTGEAVVVDMRTAGIGSRGIAVVLDFALQLALVFVLTYIVTNIGASLDSAAAIAFILVLYVAIALGYPVGFEAMWRGRTPGKAAMGLRVLRDDGGPIRFRHAFVRGLVGVVVERPGVLFFFPALLCMLVNRRSKRLGDLAAGSIVVQERVPARVAPPPAMPAPLAGWAATLDLGRVDDRLAHEVRQFLARAPQLTPAVREQMSARLVGELATRTAPPPRGAPAWAYLSAVLAERRRRELERSTPASQSAASPPPTAAPAPLDDVRRSGFAPPS